MARSQKRGLRASAAAAVCVLACGAGCDYDNSWRAEGPAAPDRWSDNGSYHVSGGGAEAALFFGTVLVVCAGAAVVQEVVRLCDDLWNEWIDDNGIGVTWDSSEGRALRRAN